MRTVHRQPFDFLLLHNSCIFYISAGTSPSAIPIANSKWKADTSPKIWPFDLLSMPTRTNWGIIIGTVTILCTTYHERRDCEWLVLTDKRSSIEAIASSCSRTLSNCAISAGEWCVRLKTIGLSCFAFPGDHCLCRRSSTKHYRKFSDAHKAKKQDTEDVVMALPALLVKSLSTASKVLKRE